MTNFIRNSKKVNGLSAYVVMLESCLVATVHVLSSESTTTVNIFHSNGDEPQVRKVRGVGYNRLHAALSGLKIDGHEMSDNCEVRIDCEYGPTGPVVPEGYSMANWDASSGKHRDCYKKPGLFYLSALGYSVIQVL